MFTFHFSFIDFIDFTVRVVIFLRFKVDIGTEVMHTAAARPVRRAHGNVFESAVNMRSHLEFELNGVIWPLLYDLGLFG